MQHQEEQLERLILNNVLNKNIGMAVILMERAQITVRRLKRKYMLGSMHIDCLMLLLRQ